MKFERAVRKKARLRLALTGPSGSGKTMGALAIARGIGGRIALIDTECDSASLYAEPIKLADGTLFVPPEFDALNLSAPFTPERFIEAIHDAEGSDYTTLIIDSTTHEWNGVGGCLELVDEIARSKYRGNSWSAWNEVTPRHRAFIDALQQSPLHIIATMRSKTETAQTEGPNGKKQVVKLGMKAEQRDGSEYEFTTVLDLVHDGHFAVASKDRTGLFNGDPKRVNEQTGQMLLAWLQSGAKISESALADFITSIADATDLDALKHAFATAYRSASLLSDADALTKLEAAKDERKAALEKKATKEKQEKTEQPAEAQA